MKERTWLGILLSFAAPCRGKMAASVVLAILSVAGGFVPYLGVYQIIRLFLERQANWEGILFWCGVCLAGYAVKVAGYALSTMLAHVSAYTILEGLRLQAADRLMGAPLGEVDSRPIGAMKSTIVDRIEDIEPPLAHMIPELSSNILLPLVVAIAMFAIDWRMGLALLVTIPVALIPMAFGLRTYNKNYAAYMAANAHVNSVIVEYVEGIQVVKAFSQGERSYQKFANAVRSFRDFTMDWFRCTWASMNLCLSILPTTLLGTLPMGIYLYQAGALDPAQVTLCLMLALGIVTPLMSATAFINSMKSMQFAVKDTRELLDLPQLSQAEQDARFNRIFFGPWDMRKTSIRKRDVEIYFRKAKGYKYGDVRWTQDEWDAMRANAGLKSFPNTAMYGITVRNADLREMPSHTPRFSEPTPDPRINPFDYFQYSLLPVGTPVFIAHTSRDGNWYYVETPVAAGWVDANDIGIVDEAFEASYKTGSYVAVLRDNVPLPGSLAGQVNIGTVLPLAPSQSDNTRLAVLVPVKNGSRANVVTLTLAHEDAAIKPLPMTPAQAALLQHAVNGARHHAQQLGGDLLGAHLAIAFQHIVQSVPGGVGFHE